MAKTVKNLPKSESKVLLHGKTRRGDIYVITNCPEKQRCTLWKIVSNEFEKITTSNDPLKLDRMIPYFN